MWFGFDEQGLLLIKNPNIPQIKEYHYQIEAKKFSGYDQGILVYHKKQWKIINFKNLGNKMQIAYLNKQYLTTPSFHTEQLENILAIFHGFDEESGESYHFLPFFSKNLDDFQKLLDQTFWLSLEIQRSAQATKIHHLAKNFTFPSELGDQLSMLFALVLVYGKWEEKSWSLMAFKIQFPLFAQRNTLRESFDHLIVSLQDRGLFIQVDYLSSENKTIAQITSKDAELLTIFAKWIKEFTSSDSPSLSAAFVNERTEQIKSQLIDYIKEDPQLAIPGKEEVLEQLQHQRIKFLTY